MRLEGEGLSWWKGRRRCDILPPKGMDNTVFCSVFAIMQPFSVGEEINQASRVDDEGGTNKVGKQDGGKLYAI